jgi:serine/threonine protein kinase
VADKDELSRFIAGKLNQSDADRIVHELANSPELRALFAELTQTNARECASENHDKLPAPTLDLTVQSTADPSNKPSIANYKMLQLIGEGGMGQVWIADQFSPIKRRVAVKLIKSGVDSKSIIARFEAERQALALMDHPCIAKILDGGTTERGQPFFAMELVHGTPITEYCDRHRLGLSERLQLFVQVCDAVQHAHQKGIIHRDLKPSNVLVGQYDDKPVPKVIDFGLAKALGHQSKLTDKTLFTEIGTVIGTLQYMSPEQAEIDAVDIDTRSDIYSLGVLLYELLTGSTPIERSTLKEIAILKVLQSIRELEPPRPSDRLSSEGKRISEISNTLRIEPSKLRQELRGDLDWIVMKALEKNRTRRYDTANGFASDIRRYLTDQPVLARPPSAVYRFNKFVKKHRFFVGSTAIVLIALFLGLVGTTLGLREARLQFAAATKAGEQARQAAKDAETAKVQEAEARRIAEDNFTRLRTAEAETMARVKDLEEITAFQQAQLSRLDPPKIAKGVQASLIQQVRSRIQSSKLEPESESQQLEELQRVVSRVNFLELTLSFLRDNIFQTAKETIDSKYKSQPVFRASMLNTLGRTTRTLGILDISEKAFVEALALRRENLGNTHVDTAESIWRLAGLRMGQARLQDAEPLAREALTLRRQLLGESHQDTLKSLADLGYLMVEQGKLSEAEELYLQALELRRSTLGEAHADTINSVNNLSFLLQKQGKFSEAEKLLSESLESSRRALGDNHQITMTAINNLATLYVRTSRVSVAEPLLREGLSLSKATLGDRHPDTLILTANLAALLLGKLAFHEAEPLLREAADGFRNAYGLDHPNTLTLTSNLARCLEGLGRLADAESLSLEALDASRKKLGNSHPLTLSILGNLGATIRTAGRPNEAEPLAHEAYSGMKKLLQGDHVDVLRESLRYGLVLADLKRWEEATQYLLPNARSGDIIATKVLLDCYVKSNQQESLKQIALELAEVQRQKNAPQTTTQADGLFEIGQSLHSIRAFELAEPLLQEAIDISNRASSEDWKVVWFSLWLAETWYGLHKNEQAASLMEKSYAQLVDRAGRIPEKERAAVLDEAKTLLRSHGLNVERR